MPENHEDKNRADQPDRRSRRVAGRRSRLRWWHESRLAAGWQRLTDRLYNWWHPPSEHHGYGYGYGYGYGNVRRSRPVRAWRQLKRWLRRPFSWMRDSTVGRRLYIWWYPRAEFQFRPARGDIRKSRLVLAWEEFSRRWKKSKLAAAWGRLMDRLYAWWYPPSKRQHGHGYGYGYGYGYGNVRHSRPVQAWRRLKRTIRRSAVGRGYRAAINWWLNWWYPVSDSTHGYGYGYGYGYGNVRRSRPVHEWRRFNRWFRKTWLGRKWSWLLDDIEDFFHFLHLQIKEDFAWDQVKKWLFRWQTAIWLPCLLAALISAYKFGVPRLRHYREQHYAQQAQQLLVKGDFMRAIIRAQQVLALNSSNAVATRVFADMADAFGSPEALYWRQRALLLAPGVTNQIALVSTALRVEQFPFPTATKTLDAIVPAFQQSAAYHRVAGALALKLGNLPEAEQHYAEAVRLEPANPVNRMSLAVVRLQSKDPKIITDSRTTLELLRSDRHLGLLATRSLVAESIGRKDYERAEILSRQVITNAQSTFSDRILHLAILNAEQSSNFQDFLADTEQRARENVYAAGELASWMNTSGCAQQARDWLKGMPPQFIQQGILPIALADSYVALRKWNELESYLERTRWPGLEHVRFAMMALASAKQSGDLRHGSVAWESAIQFASRSPANLNMLATLAAVWGWKERTEEVLWAAEQNYPDQSWPLMALNRFYASQRDTAGLWRVAKAAVQNNPKDTLAANNYAMLSLLLDADTAKACALAAELHKSDPKNPVFASTYAFSLYKQGRTPEALAVFRSLGLDQLDNPAVAVYYGIMLSASGDRTTAKHYLDKSSQAFLLPEEAAMVQQAKGAR